MFSENMIILTLSTPGLVSYFFQITWDDLTHRGLGSLTLVLMMHRLDDRVRFEDDTIAMLTTMLRNRDVPFHELIYVDLQFFKDRASIAGK